MHTATHIQLLLILAVVSYHDLRHLNHPTNHRISAHNMRGVRYLSPNKNHIKMIIQILAWIGAGCIASCTIIAIIVAFGVMSEETDGTEDDQW